MLDKNQLQQNTILQIYIYEQRDLSYREDNNNNNNKYTAQN